MFLKIKKECRKPKQERGPFEQKEGSVNKEESFKTQKRSGKQRLFLGKEYERQLVENPDSQNAYYYIEYSVPEKVIPE